MQVRHLTSNDVEVLCSLPKLRRVDGKLCRDYSRLLRLARLKPECNVEYTVELGGVCYSSTETAPVPGKCSREAVERALHRLPHVQQMDLRQAEIPAQEARLLSRHHPKIEFTWTERLGDITFSTDAVELDISGTPLSNTAPIEDLLPNLPRLQKLIACDCGLDSETMADLGRRYPHIRFVWRVKLGPLSARTDDTWFAPITKHQLIGGHDVDELKYCTDMECIDLGHCWIDNCEWAPGHEKSALSGTGRHESAGSIPPRRTKEAGLSGAVRHPGSGLFAASGLHQAGRPEPGLHLR